MRAQLLLAAALALPLAACGQGPAIDPHRQIGANPELPAQRQYLFPPMGIARSAPWAENEAPRPAAGLRVAAFAKGLKHPRVVYTLPNGDVLAVETNGPSEPVTRPKSIVMGWVEAAAGAGGAAPSANRITLLRDADGDGVAEARSVLLDHLNSPFGVALIGHDLYVANTDAILRFPYADGDTHIAGPGTRLTDLPGGPIDHHWTKALLASPDGTRL
jgi:glucose/arabinose dehydrogenase